MYCDSVCQGVWKLAPGGGAEVTAGVALPGTGAAAGFWGCGFKTGLGAIPSGRLSMGMVPRPPSHLAITVVEPMATIVTLWSTCPSFSVRSVNVLGSARRTMAVAINTVALQTHAGSGDDLRSFAGRLIARWPGGILTASGPAERGF